MPNRRQVHDARAGRTLGLDARLPVFNIRQLVSPQVTSGDQVRAAVLFSEGIHCPETIDKKVTTRSGLAARPVVKVLSEGRFDQPKQENDDRQSPTHPRLLVLPRPDLDSLRRRNKIIRVQNVVQNVEDSRMKQHAIYCIRFVDQVVNSGRLFAFKVGASVLVAHRLIKVGSCLDLGG